MNPKDIWYWKAIYKDGGVLPQYEEDGAEHGFKEVDQKRLKHLVLVSRVEGFQHHVVSPTGKGTEVTLYNRRVVHANLDTGEHTSLGTTFIVGLRSKGRWPRSRGRWVYTFFCQDGSVLVSDDLDAL